MITIENHTMIKDFREKGLLSKEENGGSEKPSKAPTGLRSWLGLKDPRIVRVSRTFGGKDRHSKVSTVRGLRDRRVRLSVPTAIQLYDLQDRLGLNQPSKVVDWLLNATQHEIDRLPPLQIPPGTFAQFTQSMAAPHHEINNTGSAAAAAPTTTLRMANTDYMEEEGEGEEDGPGSSLTLLSNKGLNHTHSSLAEQSQQANWRSRMEQEEAGGRHVMQPLALDDLFPRNSSISTVNALPISSNAAIYATYYHLEPSHAAAGSSSSGLMYPSARDQEAHHHSYIHQHLPSSLSLLPGSQLMLCPSGAVVPSSMLQPYTSATAAGDYDPKHNHFHVAPSASQSFFGSPHPASFIPNSSFPSDQHLFKASPFSKAQQK